MFRILTSVRFSALFVYDCHKLNVCRKYTKISHTFSQQSVFTDEKKVCISM